MTTGIEFAVFDLASGAISARHWLMGQPATQLVYPGELGEPPGVTLGPASASLAVFTAEGAAERWTFELATGELETAAITPPARTAREENELPVGGAGVPALQRPPFPQALLPAQAGAAWRIPALVNGRGEALVLTGEECLWFDSGSAGDAG
jgi:hypothetical protein